MSENSSSASHTQGSIGDKFKTSTVSENMKSGVLGDGPISVDDAGSMATSDSSKNKQSEDFGSKGSSAEMAGKIISPAGEPSSSFINTSAVKN